MGADDNKICLKPGRGSRHPTNSGLPSFPYAPLQPPNRPSPPLNSTDRPSVSSQSSAPLLTSNCPSSPFKSSHQSSVPLESSHRPSAPLQSTNGALSRNSEPITVVVSQAQATSGVIRYSRDKILQLQYQVVASATLQRVTEKLPSNLLRDVGQYSIRDESSRKENRTHATEWRGQRAYHQQVCAEKTYLATSSHLESMKLVPVSGAKSGVMRYSRYKLLQLKHQVVASAILQRVTENLPPNLRRDVGQYSIRDESSRKENRTHATEWRIQRAYHPQVRAEKAYLATSSHSESMKPVQVSGPSALAKAAVPWNARGKDFSEKDKVLKTVKGILNKLTPDKFDKLKDQLLNSGITTADILQGVISLLFDKAVMEPTFCFMYAELCVRLSEGLPQFPSEEPNGKPIAFRSVLLNTCQREFEGADTMRAQLKEMTVQERLEKEQLLKRRTLGNIRLIAELFKQNMLPKPIVHACIQELFGEDVEAPPLHENVEAICQLFSLIGKQLEEFSGSKNKGLSVLDSYMVRLKNIGNDSRLESRIRFMVRDVIELRANKWIPRREEVKAKTISEIHTEAERKLGLRPGTTRRQLNDAPKVVMQGTYKPEQDYWDPSNRKPMGPRTGADSWRVKTIRNNMPGPNLGSSSRPLPTQPTVSTSILPAVSNSRSSYRPPPLQVIASTSMEPPVANANLLPQGKWSSKTLSNPPLLPRKPSALILSENEKEEKPILSSSEKVEQKPKQIQDPCSAPSEQIKAEKLTAESDLERKSRALLKEYFHLRDMNEARQCVQELDSPGYHARFLFQAISMALEQNEVHVEMVGELIHHLFLQQTLSDVDIRDGLLLIAEECHDLVIDFPLAPKYLGGLFARSTLKGTVDLTLLFDVLTKIEDIEIRRKILDTALTILKSYPKGQHLLSVQEAQLSKCEKLTEE